jgi:hypothetical protein
MGFYPQGNLWQCGPFALKHALAMLGVFTHEHRIARLAGSTAARGTDEAQLRRAARSFRCSFSLVRHDEAEDARRALTESLDRGIPALLCVHQWAHWITVVKQERGRFIVLDSEDDAVLTILTWRQLGRAWAYREEPEHVEADEVDEDGGRVHYDFHPVTPRFRVETRPKFSIARARYLRRPENRALAERWEEYVSDLGVLCRVRTPLSEQVISMGEFLRRHDQTILRQVDFWHGEVQPRRARRILEHMHFVADTLGMVVHRQDEKRALAGITAILTLWAANYYGTAPVYQPVFSRRTRGRRGHGRHGRLRRR